MSGFRGGLYPLLLRAPGHVQRAIAIDCPVCHELSGQACKIEGATSFVHDARESLAYHGKKIWV